MSNETENKNKLVIFLDAIGRTILGETYTDPNNPTDPEILSVNNPVVLHVVPDNGGRMSVQLLPIFFREFSASREDPVIFKYKKANIVESEMGPLDFRLQSQYQQLFGNGNIFVPPTGGIVPDNSGTPSKVVNLFDS